MSPALIYIISFIAGLMLLFLLGWAGWIGIKTIKAIYQKKDIRTEIQPLLNEW